MYAVELNSKAQKAYEKESIYKSKINYVLETLETNPYPFNKFDLVKLKGFETDYRIRIGKIRVKYQIIEKNRIILVYYIGPRESAYD